MNITVGKIDAKTVALATVNIVEGRSFVKTVVVAKYVNITSKGIDV